jgi:hypothetical protein
MGMGMGMRHVVKIYVKWGRCVMVIFKKSKRRFCVACHQHQHRDGLPRPQAATRSTEPLVVSQHPRPIAAHGIVLTLFSVLFFHLPSQVAATPYLRIPCSSSHLLWAHRTRSLPHSPPLSHHGQKRCIEPYLDAIFPWWKTDQ